jgi:hypothetical protein
MVPFGIWTWRCWSLTSHTRVRGWAEQWQPMWYVRIVINMLNSSEHWLLFYWGSVSVLFITINASALLKVLSHTTSDVEINIPCFFLFDPVTKRYSTSVCHASIYRVVFGTPVHTCIFVSPLFTPSQYRNSGFVPNGALCITIVLYVGNGGAIWEVNGVLSCDCLIFPPLF